LIGRLTLSTAGLYGVATARGFVYAINTSTKELFAVDPSTREFTTYTLAEEPAAVVAGENSGTVYVLGARSESVMRIDPANGSLVGRVLLPDRSARFGVRPQQRDFQGLRTRMAINWEDETVFVTHPEIGSLSVIPEVLFPQLAQSGLSPVAGTVQRDVPQELAFSGYEDVMRPAAGPTMPSALPTVSAAELIARSGATDHSPGSPAPKPVAAPQPTPASGVSIVSGISRTRAPGQVDALLAASGMTALGSRLPALDLAVAGGHFYSQANGLPLGVSLRGFTLSDVGAVPFWSAFEEFGGVAGLGYPVSHRFTYNGRVVQLTQRAMLQWWPEHSNMQFINLLDDLHNAGLDEQLKVGHLVPPQMAYDAEIGLTVEQIKVRRLALLDADSEIKSRYFASSDPLREFGLPTSRVVDLGPVYAMRTQRGVLQRWKEPTQWARAGDVTTVLAGDLARDLGLFGATAPFEPGDPPPAEFLGRVAAVRSEDN
jgi:hypothetical protein